MNEQPPQRPPGPSDYLANERIFIAWLRTSIAPMGFGFLIVKFAPFIRQIAVALNEKAPAPGKGYSAEIGVAMVALGAITAVLAYIRYPHVDKQLTDARYFPSRWLTVLVLYLLPNI